MLLKAQKFKGKISFENKRFPAHTNIATLESINHTINYGLV